MNLMRIKREPFGYGKSRDTSVTPNYRWRCVANSMAMPNWESYSIESIEVLKCAAAIKKYLTVGGQGVIEIKLQE